MTGEKDASAEMPGVEEIARLVDDYAFKSWQQAHDYEMKTTGDAEEAVKFADWSAGKRLSEARDKARAILDLLAPILAEKESLRRELHSLAVALHRKHYWHVKQWKPFDDALGLATQIDNMTAGLVPQARALAAEAALAEAVEALQPFADEKNGAMQDILWGDQPDSATMTITCPLGQVRKAREVVRAAAIRAEGE